MNNRVHTPLVILSTMLSFALPAAADPVIGLWKTEPDRKNLTSHIQIRQCGANLCGKIVKAFDPTGKEVKTKNVGKELFWNVQPVGNGIYKDGTVIVPLLNVKAKADMQLIGRKLKVTGCKGVVCDGQTWTRL
ncbi:DUF2147 domain-containing protein [Amylibacter sp.]|nr:DUF2147 domain-containing protein [Amylibacter sp.]